MDLIKKIVSLNLLVLIVLFTVISTTNNGSASVISTSTSSYSYEDLTIKMYNGSISIFATNNKKATTKYRWQTVGFCVTTEPLSSTSTTVSDINKSDIIATFWYSESDCTNDDKTQKNGTITSSYSFDEASVYSHLSKKLDIESISKTKKLYLHAIFQVYYTDDDGATKTVLKTNIYNWSDIANYWFSGDFTWGSDTKDDFYKYYNMEIDFAPGPQVNTYVQNLVWEDGTTEKYDSCKLSAGNIGESVSWDMDDTITLTRSGKTYKFEIKSYYIVNYTDGTTLQKKKSVSTKLTAADICKSSYTVPYGGFTVYFVYEQVDTDPENFYQFEDEDGNIINSIYNVSFGTAEVGSTLKWSTLGLKQYYVYQNGTWKHLKTYDDSCDIVYKLITYDVTTIEEDEYSFIGTDMSVSEIKKGNCVVEEGGVVVHFVYQKVSVYENYAVHEYNNDSHTQLGPKTTLDYVKPGETLSYSVKKYYGYYKSWVETNKENFPYETTYTLVGVYITNNDDDSVIKKTKKYVDSGYTLSEIESGSITAPDYGVTIHYVYESSDGIGSETETTTTPTPTPTATPTPITTPVPETVSNSMDTEPEPTAVIQADDRGSERFDTTEKIPSTESTYVQVQGKEYLLGYSFEKKVGIVSYSVPVTKVYTLEWTDMLGEETTSEEVTVQDYVTIQRAYGYWEITNLDYYTISSAYVTNQTLPDGSVTITADSSECVIPTLEYTHNSSQSSHVLAPSEVSSGVTIDMGVISGGTEKPSIPDDDVWYEVDQEVGQVTIINDYLSFDGTVIMDDTSTEYEGPSVTGTSLLDARASQCNENVLYKSGNIIPAATLNATYASSGSISYARVAGINSTYADTLTYIVPSINSVTVHTPVICDVQVDADNDQYNQLLSPTDDCVSLVLDEDSSLNDFTVTISNTGTHSNFLGYSTERDFSRSLRDPTYVTYLANKNGVLRNEIIFPFDVYMIETDGSETYVEKNTWVVMGRNTVTFHIPMWVDEGVYTVNCRTIAINATEDLISKTEEYANTDSQNYVATDTFNVEVSGRLYGLTIYDLSDYPRWKEAFRVTDSLDLKINDTDTYPLGVNSTVYSKNYSYNYTVGTKDQYGNSTGRLSQYTFPLVDGDHPYYSNIGVLNKGYTVRFSLETTGNMYSDASKVILVPTFWHVDSDGSNRTQVDLYYTETINGISNSLVKVGNGLDQLNIKSFRTGDRYLGIPTDELKTTASIRQVAYKDFFYQFTAMFTFSKITANYAFRTYVNDDYADSIMSSSYADEITDNSITWNDITSRKQKYYLEYYIPGTTNAVDKGTDIYQYAQEDGITMNEDFWYDDGYIIVNFNIYTVDSNGNARLSYINQDNYLYNGKCCMWVMEGASLEKTDYYGTTFEYKIGDFIMFNCKKSVSDDYSTGGIY